MELDFNFNLIFFSFISERSSPENKWANRGPQKWSGPSNFIRGFIRMQTTGRTRSNTKTASFSEQLQHSSWISPNEKGKIRKFPYNLIYLFLFFMFWNLNGNFDMIYCLAYTFLKVSKYRKKKLEFSILPKNERNTRKNYPESS